MHEKPEPRRTVRRPPSPVRRLMFLPGRLGLKSAEQVLQVLTAYCPAERLPVRSRLLVEETFDDGG